MTHAYNKMQQQGPEHAAQVPIHGDIHTQWYMIDHTAALFIAIAMHAVKRRKSSLDNTGRAPQYS